MGTFLPCNRFRFTFFLKSWLKINPLSLKVALIFLTPLSLSAQTDYAVTFKGDTLRGEFKLMSYDQLDRVQWSDRGQKKVYTALQVKSISKSGTFYEPVRYENTIKFMQVLKAGFLSLYKFSNQNSEGQYLSKKDGTGIEVPNLGFKKSMSKYLSECDDVAKRIDKGELGKRDLGRIIDLYNACLQNNSNGTSSSAAAKPKAVDSEKLLAIKNFTAQVEKESFVTKKDALDMLKDVQAKVAKNEPVPNYLFEGLKGYLADTPVLAKELDSIVALLKK